MDGVFDLVGGDALDQSFGAVKRGGMVVSVAAAPEPETARKDLGRGPMLAALFWFVSAGLRAKARKHGARYRFLFMHPSGAELAELAALADAGTLRPIVDRVFPFAEIADAFTYLEAGRAKGKVVVRMAEG
jgi:NADPH:quinone reductase-like Zn-dependent oxidoreductase